MEKPHLKPAALCFCFPSIPGLLLCRALVLERVARANKMHIKEVILSQAGAGAVLGAGMQINSQNSKLVFF